MVNHSSILGWKIPWTEEPGLQSMGCKESGMTKELTWGSQGKNTEVACHSLLQWTTFCQTSPPWPVRLGWPHTAWLSFTELDKAVVLWSHWLVFCDYGLSVSALWCPLAIPTVLLGFLLPWTWCISSQLLQQSAAAAPYLGWGYLLRAAAPDLERGVAPLHPPAPTEPHL